MSQTITIRKLFSTFLVYFLGVNGIKGNAAICDPSNTNVRHFHPNNQTVVVLQKLKHETNLNGVWYCQTGENGRKLRTDIDMNKGIVSDVWVKIKTSVIQNGQGKQKVLIECSSCRKPFRNFTEIWVNGQTSTSVWLNSNGHCIHGRGTPCDPNQCNCSDSGNRFEIAYDNLKTGTEITCSMYFKDNYRHGRHHVTANTTFKNKVLSCPDSTTLTATDEISTLTSPWYRTGSYDNDLSCSWLIVSGSPSANIVIYITHYDVTSPDMIVIYDGFSTSNTTLTTSTGLSGKGKNKDFMTTGQHALVLFTTDSTEQAQGFTMQYFMAEDLSGTGCIREQSIIATSNDQFLTTPSFPRAYSGNENCRWLIQVSDGTIKLELLFSDIQNSPNCVSDYLKIYDVTDIGEESPIVTVCTRYPGTTLNYASNRTRVLVLFVSDAVNGYRGFKLKYSSVTIPITTVTTVHVSTKIFEIFLDKSFIPLWIGIVLSLISFMCCICVGRKCRSSHTSNINNTIRGITNQDTSRNVQNAGEQVSDYEYIDENQMLSQLDVQLRLSANARPADTASYCSIISSSPLPSLNSDNLNGYLDVIADPYESPVTSRYLNCKEEHTYSTTVKTDDVHAYQNNA